MTRLYHVSEEPGIDVFLPRFSPNEGRVARAAVVWAVADTHLANYLLPRECPRVAFRCGSGSSEQDRERFFGASTARCVVAIESAWFERATECVLWLYEFSPESFECADAVAGYFVSTVAVVPVSRRCARRPLVELVESGVELRVMPSLLGLAASVASSSLAFSCIRMRNAGIASVAS